MAEIWAAAVATVAVGVYSADKAGDAAASAAGSAANETRRQYDLARKDQQPFLQAGYEALNRQNDILNGNYTGFMQAPDYTYARDAALQAQERGAAARGGYMGGGADADRIRLAEGLATQNLNNYWAKLAGQTGQGYSAANNLGALGANAASNIGNAYMNAGNARASSYENMGNAVGNFATQAAGWYGGLGQDSQGRYLGNQRGRG